VYPSPSVVGCTDFFNGSAFSRIGVIVLESLVELFDEEECVLEESEASSLSFESLNEGEGMADVWGLSFSTSGKFIGVLFSVCFFGGLAMEVPAESDNNFLGVPLMSCFLFG
jgi:hypothetical protein